MPYSKKQQIVARIAEHNPSKLFAKNRGFLKMTHEQLHDFATHPIIKAMKERGKKRG